MSVPHTYRTAAEWTKEKRAALSSPGLPTIEVGAPANFPGGHDTVWSPEHLYIAAAEICLLTTFLSFTDRAGFSFLSYRSETEGLLDKGDKGLEMQSILIKPTLVIASEEEREEALLLLDRAARYCLISSSMKNGVRVEPNVVVKNA